jgi:hypothetical protein
MVGAPQIEKLSIFPMAKVFRNSESPERDDFLLLHQTPLHN